MEELRSHRLRIITAGNRESQQVFEQHDDVIKEQIKIFITVAFIWKIPCPFWASLDATSSEKSSKKKKS